MARATSNGRKHSVKASLEVHELAKAGSSLNLKIYSRGHKLGELVIGRGSLYWFGKNRQRSTRIRWSEFAEMMEDLAYGS